MAREFLKSLADSNVLTESKFIAFSASKKKGFILLKNVFLVDDKMNLFFVCDHLWVSSKESSKSRIKDTNYFIFNAIPQIYFDSHINLKYGLKIVSGCDFTKKDIDYLINKHEKKMGKSTICKISNARRKNRIIIPKMNDKD